MNKQKTRKSIAKRFRVTNSGKILRGQSFTSHLKVRKSRKHKRRLSGQVEVKEGFAKKLRKALGVTRR